LAPRPEDATGPTAAAGPPTVEQVQAAHATMDRIEELTDREERHFTAEEYREWERAQDILVADALTKIEPVDGPPGFACPTAEEVADAEARIGALVELADREGREFTTEEQDEYFAAGAVTTAADYAAARPAPLQPGDKPPAYVWDRTGGQWLPDRDGVNPLGPDPFEEDLPAGFYVPPLKGAVAQSVDEVCAAVEALKGRPDAPALAQADESDTATTSDAATDS
jgi:hypothetical protein